MPLRRAYARRRCLTPAPRRIIDADAPTAFAFDAIFAIGDAL